MNWERYRSVMERYAIKTDDMATEDAYFMSTHMPFSSLELFRGGYYEEGKMPAPTKLMSEDEVFEQLIHNPDNEHRMVIVRGNHGTGKSHLIRYLKGKFERSPSTIYNPATEQLVFLRRLNNSVRGAFSQLLEQDAIKDPDVADKLRKFVVSSDSKDEGSFKTEILYAYIAAVRNDMSGETYKAVKCRDIASYLADSRVSEHLLREGGAISRCYNVITAPSNQILQDTTIFTEEDFNVSKIIRAVMKQGDPQASLFAASLKGDDFEITKLINYLNRFTREVIQRCADISSENAETIFAQLRRDLKKQGKNLTIFIEDFTGFTGIDQELITALSYEHGGDYADLCRVTSVIGITNDYYYAFRGNFKDRVTHQIEVTERSYGTDEFIIQMAGRYLNAIYCDPTQLHHWTDSGADLSELPISDFTPPCEWDTTTIGEKKVTLYPFNRHALLTLYESLATKSPRMFLKNVIRAQLKEYFDGKQYGDGWYFPLNPSNAQMSNDPHSSSIDRLESMSSDDKNRLKAVFAIWGDGSASGVKDIDGTLRFGGLNQAFLADVGLNTFTGIGEIVDKSTGKAVSPTVTSKPVTTSGSNSVHHPTTPEPLKAKPPVDGATKNYRKFKDDITAWFTKGETLKYDPDYRGWLRTLIRGDSRQCGAINWQDIGIPAYIAAERLSDLSCYYINDQSSPTNTDRAIVYMDRSSESRDVLMALNELNYAKGWDFEGAAYYQQRLITWLERRKAEIIEKVAATKQGEDSLPVLEWCLAIQYLKACILGQKVDTSSPYSVIKSLFKDFKKDDSIRRDTREWNDMIQFILNRKADFDSALTFLKQASATTMGAVHFAVDPNTKSCYRTDELVLAVEKLMAADWDIEATLPGSIPQKHLLYNPATLLKALYPSVKKAMVADTQEAAKVVGKLEEYIGELNQKNLIDTLSAIQELFSVFSANGIIGSTELRVKYEKPPIETAKTVMGHVKLINDAASVQAVKQLTAYSGNSLHVLYDFLRDIQAIAQKADQEGAKAQKDIAATGGFAGAEALSEAALSSMEALYAQLENMEVYENAVN